MLDSSKIISNIYFLAAKKKIAIKTIEQNAKLSVGYLARLKNTNGGSKISIMTMQLIAQELNTDIATLVECDVAALDENVLLVSNFLNNLRTKTLNGITGWQRIVLPIGEETKGLTDFTLNNYNHPLTSLVPVNSSPVFAVVGPRVVVYNSSYYGEIKAEQVKSFNVYSADIGDGNCVFVVSMNMPSEKEDQQDVLEAYLVSNNNVNPIRREYMKQEDKGELQLLCETITELRDKPRIQPKMADLMKSFIEEK